MEADWFAQRAALRCLARQHPTWTQEELAVILSRSRSWVAKWLARFKAAAPDDLAVLHARSRARHNPPPATPQAVVERILAIRDQPPEQLRRVPGPRAILYYLPRDPQAQALDVPLPRSTRTIWKVLRQHGRIALDLPRRHQRLERPGPMEEVQMDFKDASSVPADPDVGAQTVTLTKNEILTALNKPEEFLLALVEVEGDAVRPPRYVRQPFVREPDFGVTSVNYDLKDLLARGAIPARQGMP